jgi:hypothetical protein
MSEKEITSTLPDNEADFKKLEVMLLVTQFVFE